MPSSDIAAWVVAAGVVYVLYILVGYPVLLACLARWRPRPIQRRLEYRKVSVLMAVRNGERWVEEKLRSILRLEYPRDLLEILVVSDGSTDRTDALVESFAPQGVRLIRIPPSGKPTALNAAMKQATGDILFFTDVRQEIDPGSLRRLIECLGDPTVGVVSGELVIRRGQTHEEANTGLYWRYEKWIRIHLGRLDSILGATGCIYAMRRELAVPIPAGILADDVYLPLAAFFKGYRVTLEEGAHAYDDPTSLQSEFRRKVRTLAGVYQVIECYPKLLTPGNRMLLHFVSHKFGRLLLPYALLAIAGGTFWLAPPWREIFFFSQLAVYSLALLDLAIPEGFVLKRLTSPARTFVVLMAAALVATSALFRGTGTLWKTT